MLLIRCRNGVTQRASETHDSARDLTVWHKMLIPSLQRSHNPRPHKRLIRIQMRTTDGAHAEDGRRTGNRFVVVG